MAATVRDNATPVAQIDYWWKVVNLSSAKEIIPQGLVEYAVVRIPNADTGDDIFLTVQAVDKAGNVSQIDIPVLRAFS